MIKKLIYRFLEKRHYWRYVSFSEVAELYASRTLRLLALSMVNVFVAIYLYQQGYNLTFITFVFAGYYLFRAIVSYPFAYLIALIGPKHATLMSNLLFIPSLLLLIALPEYGIICIIGFTVFQALSLSLYDMAYLVDFSKVKHDEHVGKEIGYMQILDQIARGASPFIGGFIAYWFGPQATLFVAAFIFLIAAMPLFFTPEPVKTHQQITFYGIPWRKIRRPLIAYAALGYDTIASTLLWSLYIALAVFGITSSNTIYAQLGVLASLTMVAGVIAAKIFGTIIDKHRGKELLSISAVANALLYLARPFAATPLAVLMINIGNQFATAGYSLPFTKGLFALADDLPGYRIAFITLMNAAASLGAMIVCLIVAGLSLVLDETVSLQWTYGISAVIVLLIMVHKFPALNKLKLVP